MGAGQPANIQLAHQGINCVSRAHIRRPRSNYKHRVTAITCAEDKPLSPQIFPADVLTDHWCIPLRLTASNQHRQTLAVCPLHRGAHFDLRRLSAESCELVHRISEGLAPDRNIRGWRAISTAGAAAAMKAITKLINDNKHIRANRSPARV